MTYCVSAEPNVPFKSLARVRPPFSRVMRGSSNGLRTPFASRSQTVLVNGTSPVVLWPTGTERLSMAQSSSIVRQTVRTGDLAAKSSRFDLSQNDARLPAGAYARKCRSRAGP